MPTKRLLVIASYFYPCGYVGAQRPQRLVRGIGDFGWEPLVLTPPPRCQLPWDPAADPQAPPFNGVTTFPCCSPWRHDVAEPMYAWRPGNIRPLLRRAFVRLTAPILPVDVGFPWAIAATRTGVNLVRRHRVDLIWCSAPTISGLLLARRVSSRTGVPFVADFRDVSIEPDGAARDRQERSRARCEATAVAAAAGVSFVSPAQEAVLRRRHPGFDSMPHRLLYNWYDPDEVAGLAPVRYAAPTILYGGSLYGGTRRIDGFMSALGMLRDRRAGKPAVRFVFHSLTAEPGLGKAASELRLDGEVDMLPALGRRDLLAACMGADVLLMVVGHDDGSTQHAGAIPGKLFDYFSAGRPILVVGPRGCVAWDLVERVGRGIGAADDDAAGIAAAIERLLEGQGKNGPLDLSPEAVREFHSDAVLSEMAAFLDEVVDHARGGPARGGSRGARAERATVGG